MLDTEHECPLSERLSAQPWGMKWSGNLQLKAASVYASLEPLHPLLLIFLLAIMQDEFYSYYLQKKH